MYSKESIAKMIRLAKDFEKKFMLFADPAAINICISNGNRKIGRVMNVSLMPVLTCHNCKECKFLCYDIKACLQYPDTVINARMRNTVLLKRDRDLFFSRIDEKMSRRRKNKYFRWHVAGDIVDLDYFSRMVENAKNHPDFIIWTYTKNYAVVNEYVKNHGGSVSAAIPENFHVMFSEWRGMEMQNPYNFPEFKVVFKSDAVKPAGYYCPGNCDTCKECRRGCMAGETTFCHEH